MKEKTIQIRVKTCNLTNQAIAIIAMNLITKVKAVLNLKKVTKAK